MPNAPSRPKLEIFFITGETSGDRHAAPVIAELCAQGFRVTGVGGDRMEAAGAELIANSLSWGAMGVPESLRKAPELLLRKRRLIREIGRRDPAAVVLVDFGLFNVQAARALTRMGMSNVFYYFPPGSWRQEPRDWSGLAAITGRIATPFARNAEHLRASGADAHWVGHPVVDALAPDGDQGRVRARMGLGQDVPLIGLLPGSRTMERGVLGPKLIEAAGLIKQALPTTHFLWSSLPHTGRVEGSLQSRVGSVNFITPVDESHDILRASDLVIVAMGTASLEAAAAQAPMVTTYDAPLAAKWIASRLLKQHQPLYAMPNLLLGREAVPEVVPSQPRERVTAQRIARVTLELMGDEDRLETMKRDLATVRGMLGEPGAAKRTADLIVEMVRDGRPGRVET